MKVNRHLEGVVFNRNGSTRTVSLIQKDVSCIDQAHPHTLDCLSEEEVEAVINQYRRSEISIAALSRTFQVSKKTIWNILQNAKSYRID